MSQDHWDEYSTGSFSDGLYDDQPESSPIDPLDSLITRPLSPENMFRHSGMSYATQVSHWDEARSNALFRTIQDGKNNDLVEQLEVISRDRAYEHLVPEGETEPSDIYPDCWDDIRWIYEEKVGDYVVISSSKSPLTLMIDPIRKWTKVMSDYHYKVVRMQQYGHPAEPSVIEDLLCKMAATIIALGHQVLRVRRVLKEPKAAKLDLRKKTSYIKLVEKIDKYLKYMIRVESEVNSGEKRGEKFDLIVFLTKYPLHEDLYERASETINHDIDDCIDLELMQ